MKDPAEGEEIVSCTSCTNFAFAAIGETQRFHCDNPACKQIHCFQCKLNLPAIPRGGHTEETSNVFEQHLVCFAKSKELKVVEIAIEAGNTMA